MMEIALALFIVATLLLLVLNAGLRLRSRRLQEQFDTMNQHYLAMKALREEAVAGWKDSMAKVDLLRMRRTLARVKLQQIVVTEGEDSGVILLSQDAPVERVEGVEHPVYVHEHFSPLGDALVDLHKTLTEGIP